MGCYRRSWRHRAGTRLSNSMATDNGIILLQFGESLDHLGLQMGYVGCGHAVPYRMNQHFRGSEFRYPEARASRLHCISGGSCWGVCDAHEGHKTAEMIFCRTRGGCGFRGWA